MFKGTLKAGYNLPLKYCISGVLAKKKIHPLLWAKEGYSPVNPPPICYRRDPFLDSQFWILVWIYDTNIRGRITGIISIISRCSNVSSQNLLLQSYVTTVYCVCCDPWPQHFVSLCYDWIISFWVIHDHRWPRPQCVMVRGHNILTWSQNQE